jgi:hypothetical protein
MKSSCHSLIPVLPFLLNHLRLPSPELTTLWILFPCSQVHILAGWSPETQLTLLSWAELYVTTDGQSASLSWYKAPIWGLRPDLYYMCDSYGPVLVGRPLWWEVGSVFYICCWPLPAQCFYCLTFETSLFVASYDLQGHGGGIGSRLHASL